MTFCLGANAQDIICKGVVRDTQGEPVPGAVIMVEGTTVGVATGALGEFSLSAAPGSVLKVSCLGYEDTSVEAAANLSVILQEDTQMLEETVVIGYGTAKKSNISGSVASVKVSDLPKAASASVGNMLRGRAAGMEVTSQSAAPGAALNISIRGGLSGASPLVVIDGVPQAGSTFASGGTMYSGVAKEGSMINLNPNDIESIDILKDASAAAIYGSDASGGVILITTKRGKDGKMSIAYSGSVALSYISDMPEFLNAKDFMMESNKILEELNRPGEKKFSQSQIDNFVGHGTNWMDEVTRVGVVNEHNVSLTGGNDMTKALMSLSYYDNQGIARNNSMNRITGRLNVDQKIGQKMNVGINSMFSQIKYSDVPLGEGRNSNSALIYSAMTFLPTVSVYDGNGDFTTNPYRDIYPNPVSLLDVTDNTANKDLSVNGYIEYRPVQDLLIKATAGVDMKDSQHDQYIPRTVKEGFNRNGVASKFNSKAEMDVVNIIAQYSHLFADKHDVSIMGGWEFKQHSWEGMGISTSDFPFDTPLYNNLGSTTQETPSVSSYAGSSQMASFIGRLNYTLLDRYILTANFRVDGSSNFAANHQWGFFPGVSVAWKINDEPWMKDAGWVNTLKLRAGVGQTGNAGSLTGTRTTYYTYQAFAPDGTFANGIFRGAIGNPNLKWETLTDYSLGLDFGFWRNRLYGTIDLYQRLRSDIIVSKSLLSYQAEPASINYNSGEVFRSRGIDISLHSINVDRRNFSWRTDLNFSFYRNQTILRDKDFVPEIYQKWVENWNDIWAYKSAGLIQPGETVDYMPGAQAGVIKVLDTGGYVFDDNGTRLRDKEGRYIQSGEADGIIDAADCYRLANNTPIPFSINNSFTWGNWDLNVYIYGSLNGWKQNDVLTQAVYGYEEVSVYGVNALSAIKNRWSESNPDGHLPGVQQIFANGGVSHTESDYFWEKAWYLRLDNVSLGYTFPTRWFKEKINNLHAYISARNLFVLTPYSGMDPETGNGIAAYPNTRSIAFGLDLNF